MKFRAELGNKQQQQRQRKLAKPKADFLGTLKKLINLQPD